MVDFFTAGNQYSSTSYFTQKFAEALKRAGASCRVFDLEDGNFREYMQTLAFDPPDLTCSFNYLRYGPRDMWLCDSLRVPHLTYGLDAAIYALDHFKHPFACFSTVDLVDWEGLSRVDDNRDGNRILFLPHAVEREFQGDLLAERPYDVTFCGTYIDYEQELLSWEERFSPPVCEMLKRAAELVLSSRQLSLIMAIDQARSDLKTDLTGLAMCQIYACVEKYCKGKDRADLIRALQGCEIHIFGSQSDALCWRKAFAGAKNLIFHAPVSFEESLEILKKSKVFLNSSPQFRNGSHERVFYGLAAGCLMITNSNPYLKTQFGNGSGLLYYHVGEEEVLREELNFRLSNDSYRKEQVELGQKHVLKCHTWDNRVEELWKSWSQIDFSQEEMPLFSMSVR